MANKKDDFVLKIEKIMALVGFVFIIPSAATGQSFDKGVPALYSGDYVAALENFEPLARQGNPSAQAALGLMYAEGKGVPQNYEESAFWYRRAADQGHAISQTNLGFMYVSGRGVRQDNQEAAAWFRRAAEQGNNRAQFNLGLMYEEGVGVPQNYREAADWFLSASEQGNPSAQYNLGVMYMRGQGVDKNDVIAYVLFILSASQGNDNARNARDIISSELSTSQINEGQRLAAAWDVGRHIPNYRDVTTWP
jgi:uncharacterized protein